MFCVNLASESSIDGLLMYQGKSRKNSHHSNFFQKRNQDPDFLSPSYKNNNNTTRNTISGHSRKPVEKRELNEDLEDLFERPVVKRNNSDPGKTTKSSTCNDNNILKFAF